VKPSKPSKLSKLWGTAATTAAVPAPNPNSKWRIIQPYLAFPLLTPCFILAYACVTDQGPWASDGYFGPGTLGQTLVLLSPLAMWAASWLWSWEGDYDIIEARLAVCLLAAVLGVAICGFAAFSLVLDKGLAQLA
jgi:hypothetical protein